jgi:hypothetical protein
MNDLLFANILKETGFSNAKTFAHHKSDMDKLFFDRAMAIVIIEIQDGSKGKVDKGQWRTTMLETRWMGCLLVGINLSDGSQTLIVNAEALTIINPRTMIFGEVHSIGDLKWGKLNDLLSHIAHRAFVRLAIGRNGKNYLLDEFGVSHSGEGFQPLDINQFRVPDH